MRRLGALGGQGWEQQEGEARPVAEKAASQSACLVSFGLSDWQVLSTLLSLVIITIVSFVST